MRKNAKKVKKTIFKVLIFGIVAYVLFVFVDQYVKIKKKSEELNNVKERISIQKDKNQEMKNELENRNISIDNVEKIAEALGIEAYRLFMEIDP